MKTSIRRLLLVLLFWSLAVVVLAAMHALTHLPRPAIPVAVVVLTCALTLSAFRAGWVSEAVRSAGVRGLLALHLVRFLGIYFLWLHAQGRMPAEFAHRAGWGDIIAAAGAGVLLLWPAGLRARFVLGAWNIIGLFDLLVAVGTGAWMNATRPGSMIEIVTLPLALVPLFFVPILLSSHLYLLRQGRYLMGNGSSPMRSKSGVTLTA